MLKSLKIANYKCFQNFELKNLTDINLLSGDNNVGKTTLLELILLVENSQNIRVFFQAIRYIFENRDLKTEDIENYLATLNFEFKTNKVDRKIEHKFIEDLTTEEIKFVERYNNVEEFFVLYEKEKLSQLVPFYRNNETSPRLIERYKNSKISFINSSKPNNTELTILYSKIQDLGLQEKFLQYLKIIDKNIVGIEPQVRDSRTSYLRVRLENPKKSLLSSELGEGTNRFIEILSTILTSRGNIVLIDEIENGIYHSKLKTIWKAIMEIVKEEKVQLFITTHDNESILALKMASEEKGFKNISAIELYKDEDNQIYPIIRKYNSFIATVDAGGDIR